MFENLKNYFKKEEIPEKLPTNETAWAEDSILYNVGNFEKYNPDTLIGKKGFAIYRQMMLDEQVKAVTRFKRDAITSRDYFFVIDDPAEQLTEEEKERRIAIATQTIAVMQGSFLDALNGMMTSMYQGFSITEKVYRQFDFNGKTFWGIKKLPLRPFDTFKFVVDEYSNIRQLRQTMNGREVKLDITKFIHHINNPEYDDQYGQSELREAYRAWFGKDNAIKFYNLWLEKHASGVKWITPVEGKTIARGSQEYNDLQKVLLNNRLGNGILLPGKVEMNVEFPANNVAFKDAIDLFDLQIARSLLVPNLMGITPTGQTGSYSQSDTQLNAFLWTLDADAARLEESINEQLFRELGATNFGDDLYPRLKFKPVSEHQKMKIITTWKDLVQVRAVTPSETDEEHIRELLDMPPKAEDAEEINDDDNTNSEDPNKSGGDGNGGEGDGKSDGEQELNNPDESMSTGETVIGRGSAKISAFAKSQAEARVDFAVIGKNSEGIVEEYTVKTAEVMDAIVEDLIIKGKQGGTLEEDVSENIKNLKVDKQLGRKLNRTITASLKESYKLGTRHAETEIDKAHATAFSRKLDRKRLEFIAEDFFQTTALKAAGGLSDEAVAIVSREILNGTQYNKTWAEVEKSIYQAFATKGMISPEQARDALGDALGVENPDARLRTLTRTNTFTAINDSRYSTFTDPGLEGFVQAFEYSAILDSRTTQICRHMDEENHGNQSKQWYDDNASYRPPNHFNCRSLLVPVTQNDLDTFEKGTEPTIEPQEGFK